MTFRRSTSLGMTNTLNPPEAQERCLLLSSEDRDQHGPAALAKTGKPRQRVLTHLFRDLDGPDLTDSCEVSF